MPRKKTLKKNKLWPPKYYRGLTKKQALERKKEIKKFGSLHWADPKAYVGFKTNVYRKTKRRSSYTVQWNNMFPNAKTLKQRSNVTGVPKKYLQQVYNRGMAAWRTGHRPGMTPQAWSYPRVSSFLLCGKTHYGPDSNVVRNAKLHSKTAQKWFTRCKPTKLTS